MRDLHEVPGKHRFPDVEVVVLIFEIRARKAHVVPVRDAQQLRPDVIRALHRPKV